MSEIKVSVIVPCYNVEIYLRECLDSLINQTLQEIEIIVIENNSKDGTKAIIDEYAAKYPDKIVSLHQPIQGVSAARNLGLEKMRGKYVGFVDSDDSVVLEMYEKLYKTAEKNKSDLVICGYIGLGKSGERREVYQNDITASTNIFKTPQILVENIFLWNKIYSTDIIKEHRMFFDEEIGYSEDILFNSIYAYYANSICHIKEPLYLYKEQRESAATATFNKNVLTSITSCEKVTQFYIENGYFDTFKNQLLSIGVGLFRRKLPTAFLAKNKKLSIEYISSFFVFFNFYFKNDWKNSIRWYKTGGNIKKFKRNFYLTHKSFLRFIVYTPNWILRSANFILKLLRKYKELHRGYKTVKNITGEYLKYRRKLHINDKQILFSASNGANVSGSMYYMLEETLARGGYEIYMVTQDYDRDSPMINAKKFNIKLVIFNSRKYISILATAKYLATDTRFPEHFIKRPEQILINTWHGTPLKFLGLDMLSSLGDVSFAQSNFLMSDYLLYPNTFTKEKLMHSYVLDKLFTNKALLTGYPRNSAFFKNNIKMIKSLLGTVNKKIYVYMPTWRGSSITKKNSKYLDETKKYLTEIDDKINDDIIIFAKMHIVAKGNIGNYKNIRPFPDNMETYELLNIADCLITDYSSVFFDFANTGKEILLFTFDREEYGEKRGMYMSLDDLPFPKIDTVEDLIAHINSDKPFAKSAEYEAFQKKYCAYDSALAPKYVNDVLLDGKELEFGEMTDYADNAKKDFNVYFVSDIKDSKKKEKILSTVKSDPDALLVVAEGNFSQYTNDLIKTIYENNMPCIIARMSMPTTVSERIKIMIYNRTGLFKRNFRKVCLREKERLFPSLSIKKYTNLSDNKLFTAMERFLNK